MKMFMLNKKRGDRGYTLLFAVLVSALVLGVGVSILTIAQKELLLNSSARESQYAFYAADTGYECAIYWDSQGAFSTSSPASFVQCGTKSANPTSVASSSVTMSAITPNTDYTFSFSLPISGKGCAFVTVNKTYGYIAAVATTGISTSLESRGYNVGWNTVGGVNDCSGVNTAKVERALLVTY